MKGKKIGILIGVSAVVAAVGASVTVTQQNEYKLIRQFGKVDRVISSSGISFKIPFIESTQSLPKETLLYDLAASDVITKDKKTMISDSYVLWKISDPLKFAQTLNSSVESGESRINTAVYNATKNAISSMSQDQVITSRDGELSDMVMEAIGTNMDQYGIELLKFETKQLDLPDDNKEAVYERMISERDNIAATYKAEGNSEAKVIRNKTDKEVAIQISDAKKQAEILEAEGEQEYMKILAQAYGDISASLYAFMSAASSMRSASVLGNLKYRLVLGSPSESLERSVRKFTRFPSQEPDSYSAHSRSISSSVIADPFASLYSISNLFFNLPQCLLARRSRQAPQDAYAPHVPDARFHSAELFSQQFHCRVVPARPLHLCSPSIPTRSGFFRRLFRNREESRPYIQGTIP